MNRDSVSRDDDERSQSTSLNAAMRDLRAILFLCSVLCAAPASFAATDPADPATAATAWTLPRFTADPYGPTTANPGVVGLTSWRTGGGRKRGVALHGGSKGSESAVEAALRWMKKHQGPDGRFDPVTYPDNCTEQPRCEPGVALAGDDVLHLTALAGQCFVAAGYDHKSPNKFRDTVLRILNSLLAAQAPDGRIGDRLHAHAEATILFAELYLMTNDATLVEPLRRAVAAIQRTRVAQLDPRSASSASSALGWSATGAVGAIDSVATCRCIQALSITRFAMNDHDEDLLSAGALLRAMAERAAANDALPLRFPAAITNGIASVESETALGLLTMRWLGAPQDDPLVQSLTAAMRNLARGPWPEVHPLRLAQGQEVLFQRGDRDWTEWNGEVRDLFVKSQRVGDGCFDGSWDRPELTPWEGGRVGRVLITALACQSLQVYYRYPLLIRPKPAAK